MRYYCHMLRHIHTYPRIFLGIAAVLCFASIAFFALDFLRLYKEGPLSPHRRPPFPPLLQEGGSEVASFPLRNPQDIQPWMTFEYVNKNFDLPKEYLRDTLHITHTKYPAVGIRDVARNIETSPKEYVHTVIGAVQSYLESRNNQ